VMGTVSAGGFTRVALLAEQPPRAGATRAPQAPAAAPNNGGGARTTNGTTGPRG
jgi:hypothetical protein